MFEFFKKICEKKSKENLSKNDSFTEKELNDLFVSMFNKNINEKLTLDEVKRIYSMEIIESTPSVIEIIKMRDSSNLIQEDYNVLKFVRDKVKFIKFIIDLSYRICCSKYKADLLATNEIFIKNLVLDEAKVINKFNLKSDYNYVYLFNYVSEELKNDKDFILNFVKVDGRVLRYLSDELKNDDNVALIAVNSEYLPGVALKFVSDRLKNDKKFVLSSLSECGAYFKYASEELKNDIDFLFQLALNNKTRAFNFVSDESKKELALMIKKKNAFELGKFCLIVLPEYFKNDKQMVLNAVKQDGQLLMNASDELRDDKEVVMAAVKFKYRGTCTPLRYASNRLKKDREIASISIKYAPLSFQDMDPSIRKDFINKN